MVRLDTRASDGCSQDAQDPAAFMRGLTSPGPTRGLTPSKRPSLAPVPAHSYSDEDVEGPHDENMEPKHSSPAKSMAKPGAPSVHPDSVLDPSALADVSNIRDNIWWKNISCS